MDNAPGTEDERDPPVMVHAAKYITGKKQKVDGSLTVRLRSVSWEPTRATEAERVHFRISAISGKPTPHTAQPRSSTSFTPHQTAAASATCILVALAVDLCPG